MVSIKYNNVYIKDYYYLVGMDEYQGKIKSYDNHMNDYYYNEKTFEKAEIKMQKVVLDNLLNNNNLNDIDVNLLVGGDLINQTSISSVNASFYNISYLGLYNACATINESLIVLSNFLENKIIKNGIVLLSAHNLTVERQFRYPIEYGAPKKLYSSNTATGCVGILLTNEKTKIKLISSTIGRVVDYGIKDANNMGAIMAPSAANTLFYHLTNNKKTVKDYDLILTGDLGKYGSILFKEILLKQYNIKLNKYIDAGMEIYHKSQEKYAGASGPVVLPLVLCNKILK